MPRARRAVSVVASVLVCLTARSANAPIVPHSVCEILHDLGKYDGSAVAALGRYSFRQDGRWLGEQACDGQAPNPSLLWLDEDGNDGPKPPGDFELDGSALNQKFGEIRKHTTLGKFRFGTSDYDRWAVVYGRVEPRKGDAARKAPAALVFRGDGVVIFLNP